jgi:PAS domain S-box-containing protein
MARILLVQASPPSTGDLARALAAGGLEVETAPDAERALERLARARFDLVLGDPGLSADGSLELCRRVKTNPRLGPLPVVLTASPLDPDHVLRGLESGADGFLHPDQDPAALVARVRRLLDRPVYRDRALDVAAGREQLRDLLATVFEDAARLHERHHDELARRLQTEQALAAERRQLQTLIDNLPDSIYFKDAAGRYVLDNRAHWQFVGASGPEEVLGKTVFDLFPQEMAARFAADDEVLLRGGQPLINREEPIVNRAGEQRWLATTKIPLRDAQGQVVGLVCVSRDVTGHKLAADEIRHMTAFLNSLVEALPIMLFVKDARDLRFQRWNQAAEELTGYKREELLGKNDYDIFPKDEADFFIAKDREVLQGQKMVDIPEEVIRTRSGEKRILHTKKIPLRDAEGRPAHLVGISEDITERKRAEVELHVAKEAADAASRAKSDFLARMSHEIRTPMNGILGMTELVLETELTPEQREYLDTVKHSADALLRVINDILDFSKIEAGKLELDSSPFSLREMLGDTLHLLAFRAAQKGLELAGRVAPDVPDDLVGDPGRLRQIIINLVGNAIKFTERGEVTVEVRAADRAAANPQSAIYNLQFSVRDTGIGIPPAKHDLIFQSFAQADTSTTRKYGGTGLGLTISARLVEMMGGRIWVESEVEKGSTFHFTTPLVRQGPQADRPVPQPVNLEGLRVLVVDDNATNRRILEEVLGHWDMRVTLVDGGRPALAALEQAHDAGESFALVLIDGHMPGMDGFMLAERIQQNPRLAGTTLVVLTSGGQPGDIAECRRLGIASYLLKPVKQSDLLRALTNALRLPRRGEASAEPALVAPGESQQRLRVLLAEDNPVNQRLAVRLLEKRGHTTVLAGNGKEALAALEGQTFDLVLMDVEMPEMGGFEATAAIRAREQGTRRRLPILAMTAHALKGDRERCLAAGMDGYVAKPIQAQELWRVIQEIVSTSAPGEPAAPTTGPFEDVLDPAAVLEGVGGDRVLLREVVQLFVTQAPRWLAEIRDALGRGDVGRLRRTTHTLRGAVSNFGTGSAYQEAQRLDTLARTGDLAAAAGACASLEKQVDRLLPALTALARDETA